VRRLLAAVLVGVVSVCGGSSTPPSREADATDTQDGQTIKVHAGDTVRLTLDSTAWTISGSSDPEVLQQQGAQVVSPAPFGSCVVGEGCGTTSAVFRALKRGTATVDASRVSCGEARLCVGAEGRYEVTVAVT
jgi:hypothetical protein